MEETIFTSPIAVLGGGAWGTALAIHLAKSKQTVHLWEFDQDQVAAMQRDRENCRYLPGFLFPDSLHVFGDLSEAVKDVQDILIVVPSFAFRHTVELLKACINKNAHIAWATKGIDAASNQLFDKVVKTILGNHKMAVLSGPSFAKEVASHLPTAISLASKHKHFAKSLVARFNRDMLRVYTCNDLVGVQLGGAVKNVIAIASGACDGLKLGANARCALVARGLAEMMRLGIAMGARPNTFMGLSGMGDLVLTCTDNQSRNRRLGLALVQGEEADQFEHNIDQVVEGVHTVKQVLALAKQFSVEMPICEQVFRVLNHEILPKTAVHELIARAPKTEFY